MPEHDQSRRLIIHGHFYQPPRENPWTERIDRQRGAEPYHDWNFKIAAECYAPNARSRRLDGYGRITKLVNNYEWISFNFGPTLFTWLEEKQPDTYGRILEADRLSAARLGHGNAIAQAYNHVIMPLASPRDRETQIRWGVRDFERRFGRAPEGMWLPETAINDATLDILIGFGFRFIVLSPHQADRIRAIGSAGHWKNVQDGSIPAGIPYRCYSHERKKRGEERRFIDIFFYDAPLSVDVSFNHMLRNGDGFADAITAAYPRGGGDLVVIATDGEIYGHHEPFADMALSYLIDTAAAARSLELTNFGAYLDGGEPSWEVQLKAGAGGEGTAWSCSHGVGRWKEDCGCSVGAPPGWNQRWREPLRIGLDALRGVLAERFEGAAAGLLKDPWEARNAYVDVIADRSIENVERFLAAHAARSLELHERTRALSLLESQRFAQYMFTSCGWFFNDISGIEAVQILLYAARAIELAAGAEGKESLEKKLLETLARAASNIAGAGSGADVYRRAVAAAAVDASFLAGRYAILSHLFGPAEASALFSHTARNLDRVERSAQRNTLTLGRVETRSPFTLESGVYQYCVAVDDAVDVTCCVKPSQGEDDYRRMQERFGEMSDDLLAQNAAGAVRERCGGRCLEVRDLFVEDRERILAHLCRDSVVSITDQYAKLYEDNRDLFRLLKEANITPPLSLLVPAQTVLTERLVLETERWQHTLEPAGLAGIKTIVAEAQAHGIPIDTTSASRAFHDLVLEKVERLGERLDAAVADDLFEFVDLSGTLDITIDMHDIQNEIYRILTTAVRGAIDRMAEGDGAAAAPDMRRAVESFLNLARRFNFNTDSYVLP